MLKGKNVDWWNTISEQEKEAINIGLKKLENGEGIPHEVFLLFGFFKLFEIFENELIFLSCSISLDLLKII